MTKACRTRLATSGCARSPRTLARCEPDDRDASIHLGGISPIACKGGKDTVGKCPKSVALRLVVHDCRVHRHPAEDDVGMRSKVVIPGWVSGAAGVRCHDRDSVRVVEIDDRVLSARAAFRAGGFKHRRSEEHTSELQSL